MKAKNYWIILGMAIAVAVVAWLLAVAASKCFCITLHGESVMLTFVGILATFVVVGNYAQVKDIEKNFEKEVQKCEIWYEKLRDMRDRKPLNEFMAQLPWMCDLYESLLLGFDIDNIDIEKIPTYNIEELQERLFSPFTNNPISFFPKEREIIMSLQTFFQKATKMYKNWHIGISTVTDKNFNSKVLRQMKKFCREEFVPTVTKLKDKLFYDMYYE